VTGFVALRRATVAFFVLGAVAVAVVRIALRLSPGYDHAGLPASDVHLTALEAGGAARTDAASLAEATTLTLETTFLARATGETGPATAALAAARRVASLPGRTDGLAPIFLAAAGDRFAGGPITLGARGDSYYE
jgi:mannosyl-oligosaccharide alpha-1,2-mannosidase